MFEAGHPDVPLLDWETFCKNISPFLIGEVVDRNEVKLPDWVLPLARGVAYASDHLLRTAGYRVGSSRPRGWKKTHWGVYRRDTDLTTLKVRGYSNQKLWMISRWNLNQPGGHYWSETLVYLFGSTPIVTPNYQSAIYLAEYCLANRLIGLHWVSTHPVDYESAIEFAKKRRVNEALGPLQRHNADLLKAA